jgi:short-subunit dehydrogenase
MSLVKKYGKTALVAGASEGIGAAFANHLAVEGMDLILIARRKEPLQHLADLLTTKYKIQVTCIPCDLADPSATQHIQTELAGKEIDLMVYNAALSYIGAFEKNTVENNNQIAMTNMVTPMNMAYFLEKKCYKKSVVLLFLWLL